MTIIEKLQQAFDFQQENKLTNARHLFEQILKETPNNAEAWHGLGLCHAKNKSFTKALDCLQKAVALSPESPKLHNNLGNLYKILKCLEKAQLHYQEALRLQTPYPEALNNLGALFYLQGNIKNAIPFFQKALRENPRLMDAHYNLANCFASQERFLEAIPHYQTTLTTHPNHFDAMHNLGICFATIKDFIHAKPLLEKVLSHDPDNLNAAYHLGIIEGTKGNVAQAKILYNKVLSINHHHGPAHHNLATLLLQENQNQQALHHYQIAQQLMPNNATAKHMIAALTGKTEVNGAPSEYVRALFDQYAYTYDQQVTTQLHYQVPSLLRQIFSPYITEVKAPWDVLDLGCGTGLCLPYFNDIAGKMIGVDISSTMIEVARQKRGYYKLYVMDIEDFLIKQKNSYHLILAADIFVYFGQLQSIFQKCYHALKSGGFFLFSIENLSEASKSFMVRTTGRYAHHVNYIKQLAKENHFSLKKQQFSSLRQQATHEVMGSLFVLQKPPS